MQTIFTAFYQTRIQGLLGYVRSGKNVDQGHNYLSVLQKLPMHDRDKELHKVTIHRNTKWRHVFNFKS